MMSEEQNPKSSEIHQLKLHDIIQESRQRLSELIGLKTLSVVEVFPAETGWNLKMEMIEREGIPNTMDLIGLYDVSLDSSGDILSYTRINLRKRGDSY